MIHLWATKIFNEYFFDKTLTKQCQCFVQFLKIYKMRTILKKLKICVTNRMEKNSLIVKNIFNALTSIGNTRKKIKGLLKE
jgi:hypothetical protein